MNKVDDFYKVKIKNKVLLNDEMEIITPENIYKSKVIDIKSAENEPMETANTNDECLMKFDKDIPDYEYALSRTIGIKVVR